MCVHANLIQQPLTLCDPHGLWLSMGFSRQEYWSGLPCPPPGESSDPGIKPTSFMSPALVAGFFTISATWEARFLLELEIIQGLLHFHHYYFQIALDFV